MVNVVELQTFDIVDYLDSEETIAEYLSQVLADGDSYELLRAIGYIAKAQDMGKNAQNSGSYPDSI